MRRIPRSLLGLAALTVALLSLPWAPIQVRLQAAISVVQTVACRANGTATCTWAATPTVGNHIVAAVILNAESQTADIQDISATETVLIGPVDSAGSTFRGYVFCWAADATDNDFTAVTTSVGTAAAAVEISGGSCTVDGTAGIVDDSNGSPYAISVTTGASGSIEVGMVHSSSTSNYSASGSTTGIGSGQNNTTADIAGGDDVGVALGGYRVCGAAGACGLDWTSAAGEVSAMVSAAVQAAAGASAPPTLSLLGVGK
jgi:hypothetical protein